MFYHMQDKIRHVESHLLLFHAKWTVEGKFQRHYSVPQTRFKTDMNKISLHYVWECNCSTGSSAPLYMQRNRPNRKICLGGMWCFDFV